MPITIKSSKPQLTNYRKGLQLEAIAAKYLANHGLTILEHNFHCLFGEIDLICQQQTELVFVEVRYRKNIQYGEPQETITFAKQQKILNSVQYYLSQQPSTDELPCRIDVIAISGELTSLNFEWIQNAIHL